MMLERVNLPTDTLEQLSSVHHDCEQVTIAAFLKAAIFDSDFTYHKQMKVCKGEVDSKHKTFISE